MSITTTAGRTFARIARAGLAAAAEALAEVPAVELPVTTPTPAAVPSTPADALFDVLGAFADETDEMQARFVEAATGTPAEAVKAVPVETVAARIKPAPTREFYAPADMPGVDIIEAEALAFDKAADKYRAGDRGKNRARKLLDKVPAGRYGRAIVEWVPSNTDRADLDAIEAIFKANNLGPVPMKRDRDSLKVTILPA